MQIGGSAGIGGLSIGSMEHLAFTSQIVIRILEC